MQTDLLFKLLNSSLADLKTAIEKFEKHNPPSINYSEQLHVALAQSYKLVSAYVILKEQNEVSPELNLHLKLMEVPIVENKDESIIEKKQIEEATEEKKISSAHVKSIESVNVSVKSIIYPKLNININDKFRFISELFSGNSNEYNIAIEQLNNAVTLSDARGYVNGLKEIYQWKNDNELANVLYSLIEKRFLKS